VTETTPAPARAIPKTDVTKPATVITWRTHGYTVVLDEDGVHLRPGKHSLEQPDLLDLMETIYAAFNAGASGEATAPVRPTREDMLRMTYEDRAISMGKEAERAIRKAFDPNYTDDERAPF